VTKQKENKEKFEEEEVEEEEGEEEEEGSARHLDAKRRLLLGCMGRVCGRGAGKRIFMAMDQQL